MKLEEDEDEERRLRSVALQNANSILLARKRAEEELVRAKEALEARTEELAHSLAVMQATLEATTDSILVTDARRMITGFNENFVRMWSVQSELIELRDHRRLTESISGGLADPTGFLARIDEIYALAPAQTFDVLVLADGRVIERCSRTQLVADQEVGRVWSFRDVTASKLVEQALREETRILELLNATGTTISSELDLQSLVQSITDASTMLSGAQFGAFFYNTTDENGDAFQLYTLSGAPREAFDRFGHPRATPLFGPTFRGEGVIRCVDVLADERYGLMAPHHGTPQGHLPVRSYLAVPVISRSGDVIGGLFFGHSEPGVFTERSERVVRGVASQAAVAIDNARLYDDVKRAGSEREQLLEAERAARAEAERISFIKDEFLATLSHELRTPLTAILGWSQVLSSGSYKPEDLHRGLDVIGRNARAQTQLIEDLLDMSRIVSGKVRLDVQRLNPGNVVAAAVDSARPSAQARGIRLSVVLDPNAGPVSGDPNRLQQIVWNLLSNAIKFTPRDGTVKVLLERINSHVEITVSDSGQGIEPEFLQHVFERFRQADSSSTRKYGGLGLGLSIVKQLTELHGGSVRVDSAGKDKGSTFIVSLPLVAVREASGREHPRTPGEPPAYQSMPLSGLRILVVDDEPDARDLIQRVLSHCNAEVFTASGAADALAMLAQQRPDVLISDIGMPDMDGYQLIREVRKLPAASGGRTPAIALTAFARSEDRTRAMLAGYQVHISKPIEPQGLVATVASLAGRMQRD